MKVPMVLAVLIGTLLLACSSPAPAPMGPTPNIDVTVEAKVAQERAVGATVETRLKEEKASEDQPMSTPVPQSTGRIKPAETSTPVHSEPVTIPENVDLLHALALQP